MQKRLLVLTIFFLCNSLFLNDAFGQSANQFVVASGGGGSSAISGYTVNFTIGQPVTATIGINPVFTQGIQQPATGIVLPLTLLSFNATKQNNGNFLVWQTADEQNTSKFFVEKGVGDIQIFSVIDSVAAKGAGSNNYSFTDAALNASTVYYRLKMMDLDGHFTYSKTVAIIGSNTNFALTGIYPNPVTDILNVEVQASSSIMATYMIKDVRGRWLLVEKHAVNQAAVQPINVSSLASGIYYLTVVTGSGNASIKFLKP